MKSWEEFEFLPGVLEALAEAGDTDARLVIITNQSGIGRGLMTEDSLEEIHDRMLDSMKKEGVSLDGIYYCPHAPDAGCDCRKPKPGLLLRAAKELGIDLSQSIFIGDSEVDMEAGARAGVPTLLIRRNESDPSPSPPGDNTPVAALSDLSEAVRWVLSHHFRR